MSDAHVGQYKYDLRLISLGAGVQSTAMYLMACLGELTPRPSAAIFADTQAEPPWVIEHVHWLRENYGHIIPIHIVTAGSLERNLYKGEEGRAGFAQIPAFVKQPGGRGMLRRQCTYQYKIKPITKKARELLGLKPRQRAAGKYLVQQWIGISADEAQRAKPSDEEWVHRYYPLLGGFSPRGGGGYGTRWRRGQLIEWMREHGFPETRKSACYFCPFHSDTEWRQIRDDAPDQWKKSVQLDRDLREREGMVSRKGLRGIVYLHDSLKPLDQVDIDLATRQADLWGNECEGHCGI